MAKKVSFIADVEALFLHHPRNRSHPKRLEILDRLIKKQGQKRTPHGEKMR